MIDLHQTTFIIPIRIDSADREFNFRYVIQYLVDNFITNIIIKESDKIAKAFPIIERYDCNPSPYRVPHLINRHEYNLSSNTKIIYFYEINGLSEFHRTRLLNEMLMKVETPVVCNYDIDILIKPEVYKQAQDKILNEGYDVVYPYYKGLSQIRLHNEQKALIAAGRSPFGVGGEKWQSECGHCQFIRTSAYKEASMENEAFVSWGAEDQERMHRFMAMGYKVTWLDNLVYHLEHERGVNCGEQNPHFWANENLWQALKLMNGEQLREYYKNVIYLRKYV